MESKSLDHMIAKARILGLAYDNTLPAHCRAICKLADDQGRHLSATEMQEICKLSSIDPVPIMLLQEKTQLIVESVKLTLLAEDPDLIKPGGALYPESRAEACWRDCWHFLRIAIYAVAADRTSFTHPSGVNGLRELYRELGVPIASMARALSGLREDAVALYASIGGSQDAWRLNQAMLHLEEMIKEFEFKAAGTARSDL